MTKEYRKHKELKKAVGLRFKEFRNFIKKTPQELAGELRVPPGRIYAVETGSFFPGFTMMHDLSARYKLNIYWLLHGSGKMILVPANMEKYPDFPVLYWNFDENDPRIEKYEDLIKFTHMPVLEQIILAKLTEINELFSSIKI